MNLNTSSIKNWYRNLSTTTSAVPGSARKTAASVGIIALLLTAPAISRELRDQGQIFSTHDILQLTTDTYSQTITAGISGGLTKIQFQWNAPIPFPAPGLTLEIMSGGDPSSGKTLFTETIYPTGEYDNGVFTWNLDEAGLFFEAGEQFIFNLTADGLGLVIAASDPPDYPGGELYLDGELLPESWVNDLAFITFVDPDVSGDPVDYRVTITNLTSGQTFSPQLLITHTPDFVMFRLAEPASEGLASLAEGGETEGLIEEVGEALIDSVVTDGPLGPGETVVVTITGKPQVDFISMAAMMVPTNDSFVALNRRKLPRRGWAAHMLRTYDSGTEINDQNCAHIPGARCGGEGFSVESGEGFVHISDGIHGDGGKDENGFVILGERQYDWRDPVARIVISRLQK